MNINYRLFKRQAKNANGEVYARIVLGATITSDELVDLIANDSQVERSQVAVVTDAICKQIKELVLNGHNIRVGSLGTLGVSFTTKWVDNPGMVNINDCLKSVHVRLKTSEEIKTLQRSCRKVRVSTKLITE